MQSRTKALCRHAADCLRFCLFVLLALAAAACTRSAPAGKPAPRPPQSSGTITVSGLFEPVTVVRDAWGIPHITAANTDDLFFAQGFVQAQDRLFQMDLWKKAVQGRLAEVLGANFIQRDSMTRRVQYRGDLDREWASYGPGTQQMARAFTNGVNAWVTYARQDVPEEFIVAGWLPEYWKPEDLLNRTDSFLASGSALDDVFRARLVAALGPVRVDQLLPLPPGTRTSPEPGIDLAAITFVVSDALRRIGTPPFFMTLAGSVSDAPRPSQATPAHETGRAPAHASGAPVSAGDAVLRPGRIGSGLAWAFGGSRSATGEPFIAVAENARLESPSRRYLVHLSAPGFDVIGATSPWMPGVAIGHNRRIAWAYTSSDADTQDVFVERVNPANPYQVERDGRWVDMTVDRERIAVKGRERPVEYERLYTSNGAVIAQDRERHLVYTLRWTGTEPGGAGELSVQSINRAGSWREFRAAVANWKAPAAEFVYADVEGAVGRLRAGLIPNRPQSAGVLPLPGWSSARTWRGFPDPVEVLDDVDGHATLLVAGATTSARAARVSQVIGGSTPVTVDDIRRYQQDSMPASAQALIAELDKVGAIPRDLAPFARQLASWSRQMRGDTREAALYAAWDGAIRRRLAARLVQPELVDEFATQIEPATALYGPISVGAGGDTGPWRGILLVDALSEAVKQTGLAESGEPDRAMRALRVTFGHPLAAFDAARRRFDAGPLPLPGHTDAVLATDGRRGATLEAIFSLADWNQSIVLLAPGESGAPASPHYDDMASRWSAGDYSNLVFDQFAPAPAERTLSLRPK